LIFFEWANFTLVLANAQITVEICMPISALEQLMFKRGCEKVCQNDLLNKSASFIALKQAI